MIELKAPARGETVTLQTDIQTQYIEDEAHRASIDGNLRFKWYGNVNKKPAFSERIDRTFPLPVHFAWNDMTVEEEKYAGAYCYLLVSENEDMTDAWVYVTRDTSYDVYNLKIGTTYFWCVQKNGKRSEVSSFKTARMLPRSLKIDTVSNVRDMGGYRVDGGVIRQGLVYRGGEFEIHMHLRPSGVDELRRLGIRTEIDLRGDVVDKIDFTTLEPIGIKRVFAPIVAYPEVFKKEYRRGVRAFFKTLADLKNYPVYFHCWAGGDRTGTLAFILGAYLGMSYEDLLLDYEFTTLSLWGIRTRNYEEFKRFAEMFRALPGESMRDKATYFLKKHAGMTERQLSRIYDTLVEKTKLV